MAKKRRRSRRRGRAKRSAARVGRSIRVTYLALVALPFLAGCAGWAQFWESETGQDTATQITDLATKAGEATGMPWLGPVVGAGVTALLGGGAYAGHKLKRKKTGSAPPS